MTVVDVVGAVEVVGLFALVVRVGFVDVVGRVEVARPVDVVGTVDVVGPEDVDVPMRPVGPVDELAVVPVVELEVVPGNVVGTLEELGGATGTVPGGTSGSVVLVELGSPGPVGRVVVGGPVVDEALVKPVVVVEGAAVVVVVGGTEVTDVTDVTDGSVVTLPGGKLLVVVDAVPAAADRAGMPMMAPAITRANTIPRDAAARRAIRLVEIGEEKGIPGHPRS